MKWPPHGANPHYIYNAMGMNLPDSIIDFSANINPLGPPPQLRERWNDLYSAIMEYPDPKGVRLRALLSQRCGMDENRILLGNGGAEIISLIGQLLAGKRVLIVQPAFSEYEQACKTYGCEIDYHVVNTEDWDLKLTELLPKIPSYDAMFLCNPCNPTGVYYEYEETVELIKACHKHSCFFIMDEAFYDFMPDYKSSLPFLQEYENVIIIRSLTKMFAIPGLRLGYALGSKEVMSVIASYQPHWSVNAIALQAGALLLQCDPFVEETRDLMTAERERLFQFYKKMGFVVSPSKVNYYLLQDPDAETPFPLFRFLLEKGIVPRHTMNFPGLDGNWLRFAIKAPTENDILLEAMKEWQNRR